MRRRSEYPQRLELELRERLHHLSDSNLDLRRRIFDFYTIFEISRNLNSTLSIDSLLDMVLQTCVSQMGAVGGAILLRPWILDRSAPRLGDDSGVVVLAKGEGLPNLPEIGFEIQLDDGTGHCQQREGDIFTLSDLPGSPLSRTLADWGCVACAPIALRDSFLGAVAMGPKANGLEYPQADREFLGILSNHIAVALENARLYESEKAAREELVRTQDQLIRSEKLAALGRLSAAIAHEINNPLSIIRNYLLLAEKAIGRDPDEALRHLDVTREEVDRIAKILTQLLDFYSPHETSVELVDVHQEVLSVVDFLSGQFREAGIEVRVAGGEEFLPSVISREELRQVFLNILMNARDFMQDGGEIEISTTNTTSSICVTFADSGEGIPEENLDKIFEPFFTTKSVGRGTGLGLSISYGIIRRYGGDIQVSNRPGGGAVFSVRLPAAPNA